MGFAILNWLRLEREPFLTSRAAPGLQLAIWGSQGRLRWPRCSRASCKATPTRKFKSCASRSAAAPIPAGIITLPKLGQPLILMRNCPNSCGHHHIADIGFYGNVRKIGEQQAPYYQLLLGGKVNADGVQFGRQIMSVPARPIPAIIRELLAFYQTDRRPAETFSAWVTRTPDKTIKDRLLPLAEVTATSEDIFVDWGDTQTYSLNLGPAAAVALLPRF